MKIKSICSAAVIGAMVFACGGQVMASQCSDDSAENYPEKYATALSTGVIADVSLSDENDNVDLYKFTAPSAGRYSIKITGYDEGRDDYPLVLVYPYGEIRENYVTTSISNDINGNVFFRTLASFDADTGEAFYVWAWTEGINKASDYSFFIFKTPETNSWIKADNDWYYYSTDKKDFLTGWQKIGGQWYLFNDEGTMLTGWQKDGGKWYYLASSGEMLTGWQRVNGTWYFIKKDGAMAADEYCEGYWLNSNGSWTYPHKAKWTQDSTGWWYGDPSGWYAKSASYVIDGKKYNFNSAGYCTNP